MKKITFLLGILLFVLNTQAQFSECKIIGSQLLNFENTYQEGDESAFSEAVVYITKDETYIGYFYDNNKFATITIGDNDDFTQNSYNYFINGKLSSMVWYEMNEPDVYTIKILIIKENKIIGLFSSEVNSEDCFNYTQNVDNYRSFEKGIPEYDLIDAAYTSIGLPEITQVYNFFKMKPIIKKN